MGKQGRVDMSSSLKDQDGKKQPNVKVFGQDVSGTSGAITLTQIVSEIASQTVSHTQESFFPFQIAPAVRVIARHLRDKNGLAAISVPQHQNVSSGPLGLRSLKDGTSDQRLTCGL